MKFTLLCKPFSVNAYHYRDKRHKTAEARAWEAQVLSLLEEHEKSLLEIASDFNKIGGGFRVHFSAIYPPHIFYNKAGGISSKTIDITNFEKPLLDLIFGSIMGVNDKTVVECKSHKLPGPFYAIEVTLEHDPNIDADSLVSASLSPDEDGT